MSAGAGKNNDADMGVEGGARRDMGGARRIEDAAKRVEGAVRRVEGGNKGKGRGKEG